jgi:hypothetical protein
MKYIQLSQVPFGLMLLFRKLEGCKWPNIFHVLAGLIQFGGIAVKSVNLPVLLE